MNDIDQNLTVIAAAIAEIGEQEKSGKPDSAKSSAALQSAIEAGFAILAGALRDLRRIADAAEKVSEFEYLRAGDVARMGAKEEGG